MTTLNLTAHNKPQELILAYLQEHASDVLAEKINSGTPITKDGKQLVNKKTLDGFMTFAESEAKKLAEKGARSACIEDSVIYGGAIHYFEEDSIEGKLYNADGTEYKPVVKGKPAPKATAPVKGEPPKPKQQQASLWDMIEQTEKKTVTDQPDDHEPMDNADDENDPSVEEIADALQQAVNEKNGVTHQVEHNKIVMSNGKTVDADTGEVLDAEELTESEMRQFDGDMQEPQSSEEFDPAEAYKQPTAVSPSSFDEDTAIFLLKLLDGKMDIA